MKELITATMTMPRGLNATYAKSLASHPKAQIEVFSLWATKVRIVPRKAPREHTIAVRESPAEYDFKGIKSGVTSTTNSNHDSSLNWIFCRSLLIIMGFACPWQSYHGPNNQSHNHGSTYSNQSPHNFCIAAKAFEVHFFNPYPSQYKSESRNEIAKGCSKRGR
ncbi:mog1/PsbP/DUF1795-like photosystem II reactioncenter PsbP family protein [Striga asiatica]|uniref:Mog1/PsbP/DUF1795-like photosystem II reactioncenter PsbP family protein n=1 Tax=Striga asiatica TaxID=4170 RepID=A0A5A7RJY4_STRAF|nr:mog1/PsbP/DUF1795-like photosystem II reactioncenter PsbP family protein [Striga asiatica]